MEPTTLLLVILVVIGLVYAKRYYNGAICKVKRDLTGQVAIITGGNTGIGRETALQLAKQNCTVIIGARDVKKSREAVKDIKERSMNYLVYEHYLDLSKKQSVKEFVDWFRSKYNTVDILINNAGISALPQLTLNESGIQMQMATNHFGHFYLTSLLWDLPKLSPHLRIINISSRSHRRVISDRKATVQLQFDDLQGKKNYDPFRQYSRSKLANVLFTQELAERLQKRNPEWRSVSVHPGVVRTEVVRYNMVGWKRIVAWLFYPVIYFVTKSCWQGAQTTIYTVFEKVQGLKNGGYYEECGLGQLNPFAKDPENQKKLWAKTEEILGVKFDVN